MTPEAARIKVTGWMDLIIRVVVPIFVPLVSWYISRIENALADLAALDTRKSVDIAELKKDQQHLTEKQDKLDNWLIRIESKIDRLGEAVKR